jgi:site-specific recombinase XerD
MNKGSAPELRAWIAQYQSFLETHGYTPARVRHRLRYLAGFARFVELEGLSDLARLTDNQVVRFIEYWTAHEPGARVSRGFSRRQRFAPSDHIGLQYTLRAFLRWAYGAGHLDRDPFPHRPPVGGRYFFPATREYLSFCQEHKGLARNSLVQIELFLRRFDDFVHRDGLRDFNQLQADHLDRFVSSQAASSNRGRIQRVVKILRGFFRYLFARGMVARDWAAALISPPQYRLARTPRAPQVSQVRQLLAGIDRTQTGGRRDFAVLLLAAGLGLRAGEIAALRLDDLDWRGERLSVRQFKNQHLLELPLPRPLVEALADYLRHERPPHSPHRHVFLRLNPPWSPLAAGSVSGLLARRLRQAGVKASGHQLRHAFAGELLRAGVGYSTLQELLGHRHFTSTQVYTKLDLSALREVADNDAQDY